MSAAEEIQKGRTPDRAVAQPSRAELLAEIAALKARAEEAEATLQAIRSGEIDALVVEGPTGEQVFTLKGAEHGYRILVETMNEGAVTLQPDGLISYSNERLARMLKVPFESVIGTRLRQFIVPDQQKDFETLLGQFDRDRRGEFMLKANDGTHIPVFVAMSSGQVDEAPGSVCTIITDLTEQKHVQQLQAAQRALRRSEEKLKVALDAAKKAEELLLDARARLDSTLATAEIGTWTWDVVNDRTVADRNLARLFSLKAEEAASGSMECYLRAVHPDDKRTVRASLAAALERASGEYETDYRIVQPDGSIRWVTARGRVERDAEGKAVRFPGVVIDITDRKQAEEALRDSQRRLRFSLESGQIGDWDLDLVTDQARRSDLHDRAFGYSEPVREWGYSIFLSHVHPDDRTAVDHQFGRAIAEATDIAFECRVIWPDKTVHWVEIHGSIYRTEDGRPMRMLGTVVDITSRKETEEALRQSEQRYRTLAEAIPQLSWTSDASGRCDYLSRQWGDYTGLRMDGRSDWIHLVHTDDRKRARTLWESAVDHGDSYDMEFRLPRSDGTHRWFKARAIPVRDERGAVVRWFGTCTDIEDIVRARQAVARNKEELERLVGERTASLKDTTEQLNSFCYTMAHDLRAPLRAQLGYARILLDEHGAALGESGRQFAERIAVAAEKLERLVQDLLSHASLSRSDLPLESVEVAGVVAQARADLAEAIQRQKATVVIGELNGHAVAHAPSLNLIVSNLLSNALKYSKPGVPPTVRVWTERFDGRIRLCVEDDGIGIKPEYHEKIFGMFQRLHAGDRYQGNGIGLALVRKGIERMGGEVGLESAAGKGSRFWIDLNAADEVEAVGGAGSMLAQPLPPKLT